MDATTRDGAKPVPQEVLHSRALAHVDRSSLLRDGLDRDDETCGYAMTCVYRYFRDLMIFVLDNDDDGINDETSLCV